MRRLSAIGSAFAVVVGLALTAPAAAAAGGAHALTGACNGTAYPPAPHAMIMASTTTPAVGETIEASGTAYCPDEDVRITLDGKFVTTAHTDVTGSFDPPVTITRTGDLRLCGTGASGLADDRDCLMLSVRAGGAASSVPPHRPNGGGTAFTGVDVLLLGVLAAVLLGVGWAFAAAGRRKRADAATHV
jgi:hypothetical protein